MRRISPLRVFPMIALCAALSACGAPTLPDSSTSAAHRAPYPALVPLETLDDAAEAPRLDDESGPELSARAARLRARAARLRAQNGS